MKSVKKIINQIEKRRMALTFEKHKIILLIDELNDIYESIDSSVCALDDAKVALENAFDELAKFI